jgi:hypothetical protein
MITEPRRLPDIPPPGGTVYSVKQPDLSPPTGWNYREPTTDREWLRQPSLDELAMDVAKHRNYNSIPVGDPKRDIMHFTGSMLIDAGYASMVITHAPVNTSLLQYWEGANAYLDICRAVAEGKPLFVSIDKARERAQTCIACPKNVVPNKRNAIKRVSDWKMLKRVGGRKLGLENHLKVCQVCSCQTAVLVNLTEELLATTGALKHLENYPSNCWKHRCKKHVRP